MTADTHDDLRALAEKATPGEWAFRPAWNDENEAEIYPLFDGPPDFGDWSEIFTAKDVYSEEVPDQALRNAAFVVAANPARVIALLDEIDRLRQRNAVYAEGAEETVAALLDLREEITGLRAQIEAARTLTGGPAHD